MHYITRNPDETFTKYQLPFTGVGREDWATVKQVEACGVVPRVYSEGEGHSGFYSDEGRNCGRYQIGGRLGELYETLGPKSLVLSQLQKQDTLP